MQQSERLNLDDISKTIAIKVIKIYDYLNKDIKDQDDKARDKALNFGTVARKFSLSAEDAEIYLKSTCAYSQNQENHEVCDLVAKIYENYESSKSSHQTKKRFAAMENERINEITKVLKDSIIIDRQPIIRSRDEQNIGIGTDVEQEDTLLPILSVNKRQNPEVILVSERREEDEVLSAVSLIDDDTKIKIKEKVVGSNTKASQAEPEQEVKNTQKQSHSKIWWIAALILFFLFVTLRMINLNNGSINLNDDAKFEPTTAPKDEPLKPGEESILSSQPPIATINGLGLSGEIITDGQQQVQNDVNPKQAELEAQIQVELLSNKIIEKEKKAEEEQLKVSLAKEQEKVQVQKNVTSVAIDSIEEFEKLLSINEIVINKDSLTYGANSYKAGESIAEINILIIHEKYIKLHDKKRGLSKLIILKKRG